MGFRGKYKNKRDQNEPEIVAALKGVGVAVVSMDQPVDLLCWYGGETHLVEVKMPDGDFTKTQKKFLENWPGEVVTLRSVEEAIEWAKEVRGKE